MHTLSRPMDPVPAYRAPRLQRQLERSLLALLALAAVAGLALVAARPAPLAGAHAAAHMPVPTLPAEAIGGGEAAPPKRNHRRSRQTLAMPYFSFAAGN